MIFYRFQRYITVAIGFVFLSGCSYVPDRLNPINWASSGYDWVMGEDDYYDDAPDLPISRTTDQFAPCRGTDVTNWHNCQGAYTFSNGDQYIGGWKDGRRTGHGTYLWPDGEKYVGEFRSGTKSGQGNYYFTDGEIWTGLFENGKWISGTKYGPGEAPHDLIQ